MTFWTRYDKPWKDKVIERERQQIEKEVVVDDGILDAYETKGER